MAIEQTPAISQVVVPVDGSPFAEKAIGPGRVLAQRLHAPMTLITVVAPDELAKSSTPGPGDAPSPSSPIPGAEVVVGDDAGETIGAFADRVEGSVICMATHGRGWPASAFIGSAASTALARSDRPMVVVGPQCHPDWTLEGATVVAAVDGQAGSEEMVPVAGQWAAQLGMGLTVVMVAEPAPTPLRAGSGPHGDPQAYLDKLVVSLGDVPVPVSGQVLWDPIGPADGLRSFLDAQPGGDQPARGLLVLSSHGRSRRPGIPLGRTALRVVHESPVPCLIVPLLVDQP